MRIRLRVRRGAGASRSHVWNVHTEYKTQYFRDKVDGVLMRWQSVVTIQPRD